MSELDEKRWAVVSERGAEQRRLSYNEAMQLVGQLTSQKIRGLTVISDEAAARLSEENHEIIERTPSNLAS